MTKLTHERVILAKTRKCMMQHDMHSRQELDRGTDLRKSIAFTLWIALRMNRAMRAARGRRPLNEYYSLCTASQR